MKLMKISLILIWAALLASPVMAQYTVGGTGVKPGSTCGDTSHALGWTGTAYNCQAITGTAAAGGTNTQLQRNNANALGGISGATSNGTSIVFANSDLLLQGSSTGQTTFASANAGASNYTLTLPAVTDTLAVLGTAQTFVAAQTFTNSDIKLLGSSTGATTLTSANASATNYTLTIPAATDTLALLAATQTLTNKTISGASNTLTNIPLSAFTNLGTGTTVLHGNASGNPSFSAVSISTDVSGLGTGVATALGVNVGSAGSPVVNGGALGTPSSGTLTSATGLPLSTGISGLGSGVATALAITHDTTGGVCTVGGSGCAGGGSGNALFGTTTGNVANDVLTMSNTTTGVQDSGTSLASLANVSTAHQISGNTTVTAAQFLHGDAFIGSAALSLTYPATSTLSANGINLLNAQGGAITVTPNTGDHIWVDGVDQGASVTYVLAQGNSAWVTTNTSGQLQLALAVGGTVSLSGNNAWTAGQAVTPDTSTSCGTITSGGTATPNFANSNSCQLTFGTGASATMTIANPSGVKIGQDYLFTIAQNTSGSGTASFGGDYDFGTAGAPTLTTTASKIDEVSCYAYTTSKLTCSLVGTGF